MDLKLTNATGKSLYYKILDSEGPYARFDEDALPGMYPGGQNSNYTDSDTYLANLDTKVGNQRRTLSSRYPKFNNPRDYMSNWNLGQQPSRRSYDELQQNYPEQSLGNRKLDGNIEGVIPLGLHRDIMLPNLNCNIYLKTIGKPKVSPIYSTAHFDILSGASELFSQDEITPNDPRHHDFECTIKAARLRENHVVFVIEFGNRYHGYTSTGSEFKTEYPQDISVIALQPVHHAKSANPFLAGFNKHNHNFSQRYYKYPYASVDTLPMTMGTYIDSLREDAKARKRSYSSRYVDMTNSNYSDDYDTPILGYFDRRFLYRAPYDHQ